MSRRTRYGNLATVLLMGLTAAAIVLGSSLGVSYSFIIIFVMVAGLILGTMLLWQYANHHADGSEWWQDDSASGWRGY